MFDNLTDRLSNSFKALQGKIKLSESNIKDAIREVRRSLLEADAVTIHSALCCLFISCAPIN